MSQIIHTVMYRTEDSGKTWECCGHMPFHQGFEASPTVIDGVIYVQTHEFPHLEEDHPKVIDRIFCSEDKGHSWYETRVDPDFLGTDKDSNMCLDRNFIQLEDGSVAGFVAVAEPQRGYTLRLITQDHGRTWTKTPVTERVARPAGCNRPILDEAFFFRTPKTGRLMAISRVEWALITQEQKDQIPYAVKQDTQAGIDSMDGLLLLESKDEGLSWDPVRGLGYLGMMYPSVAYINDEDFVLTYTKRTNNTESPYNHMGVQAVLGKELPDGSFDVDFEHDIIVIDDRTPDYSENGCGYGTTYLLSDGSFITPYSYRFNTPVLDEILRTGGVNDEEVFMRYYKTAKQKRDSGLEDEQYAIAHFRRASLESHRHVITKFATEKMESLLKSQVLKWKLHL